MRSCRMGRLVSLGSEAGSEKHSLAPRHGLRVGAFVDDRALRVDRRLCDRNRRHRPLHRPARLRASVNRVLVAADQFRRPFRACNRRPSTANARGALRGGRHRRRADLADRVRPRLRMRQLLSAHTGHARRQRTAPLLISHTRSCGTNPRICTDVDDSRCVPLAERHPATAGANRRCAVDTTYSI